MKQFIRIALLFGVLQLIISGSLFSQQADDSSGRSEFKHAINVCPIAPVFGIYAVNYEYLFKSKQGILARVEYEDIPKTYTAANIEANGWAYSLNYRRHFNPELNSLFLGAYARYREYNGSGNLEGTDFDFKMPTTTIGLNGGKRWVWNSGFDITISAGWGVLFGEREASSSALRIESVLDDMEDQYEFMGPFYGEVSAGFAF